MSEVTFLNRTPTFPESTRLDDIYIGVLRAAEKPEGAEAAFELETVSGPMGQVSSVYLVAVDVENDIATILQFDQIGVS